MSANEFGEQDRSNDDDALTLNHVSVSKLFSVAENSKHRKQAMGKRVIAHFA
jgi:hypothetical protein